MSERRSALNLSALLAAADASPPIAAAEVIGAALAESLAAREISFLIADFSGRALVRLSHVSRSDAMGALARERTERVPLVGTPQGQALAKQKVEVLAENGGAWLFARCPVGARPSASWSCGSTSSPTSRRLPALRARRTPSRTS